MMSDGSEKVDTGLKVMALVAIIGLCLIISGIIIITVANYYNYAYPDWVYRAYSKWISIGHIAQAIGVLMLSMSFIWTALVKKALHHNVRASLIVGSMILLSIFILITITRYGYVF